MNSREARAVGGFVEVVPLLNFADPPCPLNSPCWRPISQPGNHAGDATRGSNRVEMRKERMEDEDGPEDPEDPEDNEVMSDCEAKN